MNIKILFVVLLGLQGFAECVGRIALEKKLKQNQFVSLQAKRKIAEYELKRNDYVISISIPKCGTHLMKKCLDLLNAKDIHYSYNQKYTYLEWSIPKAIKDNQRLAPDYVRGMYDTRTAGKWPLFLMQQMKFNKGSRSFSDHWSYTSEAEELFYQCTTANFFIIRDPRDMIVSMAHFLHKGPQDLSVDVNALIFDFIDGRMKSFVPWGVGINEAYPLLYSHGITDFYKLYLKWMEARKFLTVKFEDLVGPNGGGSLETQLRTIKCIAEHLNIVRTDQDICNVAQNLFGKSSTFREGKIGSWRNHFTQEMIRAYKKVPGACKLLVDLGYEKDDAW